MRRRPAIFFDRDGVLNPDSGYPHRPEDAILFPDVADALRRVQQLGYMIVVVSNQSGVGRGLFSEAEALQFNALLAAQLRLCGVHLAMDQFYICPHTPDEKCDCRKPKPGLLLRAVSELNIDLTQSFAVGDHESDIEAAYAAGVRAVLLNRDGRRFDVRPDYVVSSLTLLADLVERLVAKNPIK
ncbi:MAG TPA: HAD family hydrolase [Verrucomicrobiota bacterium]|nr:HAD family hydrolase [Verrucomicrobiota bacterium]